MLVVAWDKDNSTSKPKILKYAYRNFEDTTGNEVMEHIDDELLRIITKEANQNEKEETPAEWKEIEDVYNYAMENVTRLSIIYYEYTGNDVEYIVNSILNNVDLLHKSDVTERVYSISYNTIFNEELKKAVIN